MIDIDTFVITVYVMVDDFCKSYRAPQRRPAPASRLSRSEVVTLALMGQWGCFLSERGFYRWAQTHLSWAFPHLPDRSQLNRQIRDQHDTINAFSLSVVEHLHARHSSYEIVDGSAAPTRDAKRRGRGWLPGLADIGWSNRLGWYEGFKMLLSISPLGVITGFGFGPASTNELLLADTFFAARSFPHPALPTVGPPAVGPYLSDKGFGLDPVRLAHLLWEQGINIFILRQLFSVKNRGRVLVRRRSLTNERLIRLVVRTNFRWVHGSFRCASRASQAFTEGLGQGGKLRPKLPQKIPGRLFSYRPGGCVPNGHQMRLDARPTRRPALWPGSCACDAPSSAAADF